MLHLRAQRQQDVAQSIQLEIRRCCEPSRDLRRVLLERGGQLLIGEPAPLHLLGKEPYEFREGAVSGLLPRRTDRALLTDTTDVYGHLGPLHRSNDVVGFGEKFTPEAWGTGDTLHKMSKNLLTFTESQRAESAAAKKLIMNAKRVVFLGFGFAEQNVELLKVSVRSMTPEVRATVKGLSSNNREQVQHRINDMLNAWPEIPYLQDCDCATLIGGEQMFLTRNS